MTNKINYSQKYEVFLSYRRNGGEAMATLLHDRLVAKGYSVFLDIESLNSGSFNKRLLSVIEGCTDVVVICSPHSLDRCANAGDWVRMEIAHALKHGKNVVPILLRDFDWPADLPEDIAELRVQGGVNANSHEFFDAAVDRLADRFLQSVPHAPATNKKTKAILAAALSLVVIAALVFGGIALLGKKGTPASASASMPVDGYITIKGKQYSTALTSIDLKMWHMQDEDIVPLQYMKNLTTLNLCGNPISNLAPLSGLTNLTNVDLNRDQISDLAPLSGLKNLTYLNLEGNPITDWSPVAHVKNVVGRPASAKAPESAAQAASSTAATKHVPITPTSESKQVPPAPVLPQPPQTSAPAEPVYSLEKIPADAVRFVPRGTAYITLKDNTRYVVTGNSLMYQSKASDSLGMKNGFVKDEGGVIPFTDIKWYEDEDVWDVDGQKVDIVQDNGQLYFIELEKKKTLTSVPITQVKSIYFDWAKTFDSIVYYALVNQVDGPPLVVPAASMLIQVFNISMFGGPYYTYRTDIPFPNEENVQLGRVRRFEIAAVTHTPSGYDHTCEVEIVVEKTSGEILKDKIHDAISLCSLSKKGITSLDLYKIKNYTILEASPERIAATTPVISIFPTAPFSISQALPKPEIISMAANQIEPFRSEGTVRIVMKDGAEYRASANAVVVRNWEELYLGVEEYYNHCFPLHEFSSMKRLRSTLLPEDQRSGSKKYKYEIELRNGSVENMESDPSSLDIIIPDGSSPRIMPLADVESMDFDWSASFPYQPDLVTVLKKDGSSVSFPKALFFIGYKIRPPENAAGWFSGIKWDDNFIAEKQQIIQKDQLSGVQFLVYRISKRNFKGYDKWLKECKVEFEYKDGRKVIAGLAMDSLNLLGANNHGVTEISGEEVKYIYFGK